jgi:hypothetical protein
MLIAEPTGVTRRFTTHLTHLDMLVTEDVPTRRTSIAVLATNQVTAISTPVNMLLTPD